MGKASPAEVYRKQLERSSNNVSAYRSVAAKRESFEVITSNYGGIQVVHGYSVTTRTKQGAITGSEGLNLAFDGKGYAMYGKVKEDGTFDIVVSRDMRLSARKGGWFGPNGVGVLMGHVLDANEERPANYSQLGSLVPIDLSQVRGSPIPTTTLSPSFNLDQRQEAILGSGIKFKLPAGSENTSNKLDDILIPDRLKITGTAFGTSEIVEGTTLTFSSDINPEKTITYGGIISGVQIGQNTQIYGKATSSERFDFTSGVSKGHSLTMQLSNGSDPVIFTADSGQSPRANEGKFNSIDTLSQAINRASGFKSIVRNGRIYIAPTDANHGITITSTGGGTLKADLRLYDIGANANNERFNSLNTLRSVIDSSGDGFKLKAVRDGTNKIDILSQVATDVFNVSGESVGAHTISRAIYNPANNNVGRATVEIDAANNNLAIGDFVRISNGFTSAQAPDGLYMVSYADANRFRINLIEDTANFLAGAGNTPMALGTAPVWQKIAGNNTYTPGTATNITSTAGAPPLGTATIFIPNAATFATNDVVYVSGAEYNDGTNDVIIAAGYYRVTASTATDVTINVSSVVANAGTPAIPAGFTVRKVGVVPATLGSVNGTFDTEIFEAQGPATERVVRLHLSSHAYKIDDYISFTDLPMGAASTIDGIPLANDTQYKITNTTNDYLEFEVMDANGNRVNGDRALPVPPPLPPATLLSTINPNDFSINNISRFLNYFGIDQEKTAYDPSYDPDAGEQNLSGGNFDVKSVYQVSMPVYDSSGVNHNLVLNIGKLRSNEYAVELTTETDDNGDYHVVGANAQNRGKLINGTIKFDQNGNLLNVSNSLSDEFVVQFDNDTAPSVLSIDWFNILRTSQKGLVVTQYAQPNNFFDVFQDGQASGSLISHEVTPDGYIVAQFSSGAIRKTHRIAIADFQDPEALKSGANNSFTPTRGSGPIIIKTPGDAGVASIAWKALETANYEITEEILNAQTSSDTMKAVMRADTIARNALSILLREMSSGV